LFGRGCRDKLPFNSVQIVLHFCNWTFVPSQYRRNSPTSPIAPAQHGFFPPLPSLRGPIFCYPPQWSPTYEAPPTLAGGFFWSSRMSFFPESSIRPGRGLDFLNPNSKHLFLSLDLIPWFFISWSTSRPPLCRPFSGLYFPGFLLFREQ